MIAQIQIRRGTTAEWAAASPVILASGEPGYDSIIKSMKIGDGVTEWASLPFGVACPYDVGDVLQTMNATSPATRWAGTAWAALGGRMLIGANETYTAGATGGAATHTLQTTEIPSHSHPYELLLNGAAGNWAYPLAGGSGTGSVAATSATGGGGAHNNLPPYLAVYMWKRTA